MTKSFAISLSRIVNNVGANAVFIPITLIYCDPNWTVNEKANTAIQEPVSEKQLGPLQRICDGYGLALMS